MFLEGYCRSLSGGLEACVEPRCVWSWNLEGSDGFRWVFGSIFHFWSCLCRVCIFVGGDLGMIVRSGWGLCRVGFLVLVMFVWSCGRQQTTLFKSVCLWSCVSCVMFSSRVCLTCRGGCKYLVRMSLVLSCVLTPPILNSPSM